MRRYTTMKPFKLHAHVFTNVRQPGSASTGVSGIVSGAVDAAAGGGALATQVSFGFDTRDGSWSAAAELSFTSERITATAVIAASSACAEAGTLGTGTLSIAFGEAGSSSLKADVTVVKRCGEWAAAQGLIMVRRCRLTVSKPVLKVPIGMAPALETILC